MQLTFAIDASWLQHPEPLGRILDHVRALEGPAPWTPRPERQPGDDGDDLGTLLDGMDAPATAATPAEPPRASVKTPSTADVPTDGRSLYRWATTRKCLPDVHRIGKSLRLDKLVSNWTPQQVAHVFAIFTEPAPAAKGRA
jgi:hypothetical protein